MGKTQTSSSGTTLTECDGLGQMVLRPNAGAPGRGPPGRTSLATH
jgi:hypothetical protein